MKNNKRKTRNNPTATPNVDDQKAPELNPVIVHTRTDTRIELGNPPAKDPEEWWFRSKSLDFGLQKFELDISKVEVDSLATLKYFPDGTICLSQSSTKGYSIWILFPRPDGTIIRTQLRQPDDTTNGTHHYYIILHQDCTIEFRKASRPGYHDTEQIDILQFMYNAPYQASGTKNVPKLQVEDSTFNPTPSNHYGGPDIIESTPLEEAKVLETPSVMNRHVDPNSSQRPRPKSPLAARNSRKNATAPVDNDDIIDDGNEEAEVEVEPFITAINNNDIIEDGSGAIETEPFILAAPIAEPEQVDELMTDVDDLGISKEQNPRSRDDTRDDIFGPPLSLPSSSTEPTLRNPAIPSSSIINYNSSNKDGNDKSTRKASFSDDDETNDEGSETKNTDSENPIPDSLPEAFHHESMVKRGKSGRITTYSKKQGPHTIVHPDEAAKENEETPKKAGAKKAVPNKEEPETTNSRKRKGTEAPLVPTSKKRKDQSGSPLDVVEEEDEEVMKPPPRPSRSTRSKKTAEVDLRSAKMTRKGKGKDASPAPVEDVEEETEEEEDERAPKPAAVDKKSKSGIKADTIIPSSDGEEEHEFATAPSTIEPSDAPEEDEEDAAPTKKPTKSTGKTSTKATKTANKAAEEKEDTQWSIPDDTQSLISTHKDPAESFTKPTKTPTRKPRTGITGTTPTSVSKALEPPETTTKSTPPTASQTSTRSTRSTPRGPTKATKSTSKTPSKTTRTKSVSPSLSEYTICFSSTPLSASKPLLSFLKKTSLPICTSVSNVTHLVVGAPKRTPKFTLALLKGIPIVSDEWLSASLNAGNLLEPEDFYCQAPDDWGVDLKSVWERGAAGKEDGGTGGLSNQVLEGSKVYLTPDLQKWLKEQGNQEVVMEMLKAAGGDVVKRVPKGSPKQGSLEVVLGKEEGDGEVKGLEERGWKIYKLGAVGWAVLQGKWPEGQEEWEAKAEEENIKGKGKGKGRGRGRK
ncbi:hypothetical protein BZA77DRAFT_385784 [Pyronema omphalodes]|nr:hypothetical protein BZA77DRAFT_385784 [Pyronema omphalodes]